jgi:hypothetical protein
MLGNRLSYHCFQGFQPKIKKPSCAFHVPFNDNFLVKTAPGEALEKRHIKCHLTPQKRDRMRAQIFNDLKAALPYSSQRTLMAVSASPTFFNL